MELTIKNKLDRKAINDLIDLVTMKNIKTISYLDISSVKFVDPYGMVLLLQLLRSMNSIDRIDYPLDNVASYMVRASFFSHLENFKSLDKKAKTLRFLYKKKEDNSTMLEITKIESSEDILSVIRIVTEQTRSILEIALKYSDNEILGFITMLSELLDNIIRHSKATGYICAQVYRYPNSDRSYVSVCISDTGIGVKRSLVESPFLSFSNINDMRALRLAVIDSVTSKEKGGIGFYGIKEMVKKYSGSLYIRSGSAELTIDSKGKYLINSRIAQFTGTQIELRLPQR
ncbi:ATP-binding protein [Paenibacillus sp. NPDC058071]|uniref:ATP-binding protein n=1 Tax=Paenibacillus sp. NPDC058071 TaxID=3346326 RepID=UPI0036DEB872